MDGLILDYVPPASDAVQRAAEWPIPVHMGLPMIAWAVVALILIAGADLILPAKGPRR